MRKFPAMTLLVLGLLAAGIAMPLASSGQNRAPLGAGAAAGDDMPHRTARTFAPFLKALITHRYNTAQQIFKLRRGVELSLQQTEAVDILNRFNNKPDSLELNLVGGRALGNNIGILFFTIALEDGPVAFKIYYYGFGNDINISRVQLSDDWDEIEQLSTTVEILPSPISVALGTPLDPGP